MIGADFVGLFAPHHDTNLLRLFMLKQADVSGSSLLPFVGLRGEPEQLGATGEATREKSKANSGIEDGFAYSLNASSSSSSLVFTSTCCVNLMTGSKCGSCSSSA